MEIELGGSRFDSQKNHAHWYNVHLDTKFRVNRDAIPDAVNHLNDCIDNPTIGLTARNWATPNIPNYPGSYYSNKELLFNFPEVKQVNDVFESKFKELYPKSGKTRNKLIDCRQIVLNFVTPKMNFGRKVLFKLFGF